jgi:hypothetical protein
MRYQGTGSGSQSHHQELATIMSGIKPLSRQKSDTSFDRERPFVAVKRAHEQQQNNRRLESQTVSTQFPVSTPFCVIFTPLLTSLCGFNMYDSIHPWFVLFEFSPGNNKYA